MAQRQLLLSRPVAAEDLLGATEDGLVSCEGDLLFSSPLGLHLAEEQGHEELRLELVARPRLRAATSLGQGGT